MKLIQTTILTLILASGLASTNAQTLIIDDFDSYTTTSELRDNWNSFGTAATNGAPTLAEDEGVGGSNAAQFVLGWSSGNNANMRRINLGGTDLTSYTEITIEMYVTAASGASDPTAPTELKLAIQSTDDTIWQTTDTYVEIPNVDGYTTLTFALSDTEMSRVNGSGTLASTLADVDNIRLRFENDQEPDVVQIAYISSIAATPVPEPGTYALIFGGAIMGLLLLRRKR